MFQYKLGALRKRILFIILFLWITPIFAKTNISENELIRLHSHVIYSPDFKSRMLAIELLVQYAHPKSVPILFKVLDDPFGKVILTCNPKDKNCFKPSLNLKKQVIAKVILALSLIGVKKGLEIKEIIVRKLINKLGRISSNENFIALILITAFKRLKHPAAIFALQGLLKKKFIRLIKMEAKKAILILKKSYK